MKRREFLKKTATASAAVAVTPTEFIKPLVAPAVDAIPSFDIIEMLLSTMETQSVLWSHLVPTYAFVITAPPIPVENFKPCYASPIVTIEFE